MPAQVESFFHAPTNTWTHIVVDPTTQTAAIIDPVLDFDPASGRIWTESAQRLVAYVLAHELGVEWILETHAHADHLTAADWLRGLLPAAKLGIGAGIIAVQKHFGEVFGFGPEFRADGSQFDRLFADSDLFKLGTLDLHVTATPGHTSDGVSYLIDDAVFVGDTLFAPDGGTGRCDFPGADAATQYRSIQRLYTLPEATRVFLCHDYPAAGAEPTAQTTIGAEKSGNVQLHRATSEADYVAFRTRRDATLAAPRLLYPSLQANICAGRLPAPNSRGQVFLRLPLRLDV
jgi:glyoxylase-like metal-dependent hydrolase (beta-lactamase superfamily II)